MKTEFAEMFALVQDVAPESVGNLNPPAAQDELHKLEGKIPDVPSALTSLLELHNGEEAISWISILPNGMQLMDIESILQGYDFQSSEPDELVDVEDLVASDVMDAPAGPVKPIFFHSKRVPFAQLNLDVIWYLDLDPAAGGEAGQVVEQDAEGLRLRVIATSLVDLFQCYVEDLRRGAFQAGDGGQIVTASGVWPAS